MKKNYRFEIRLTENYKNFLEEICYNTRKNKSEVIRDLILEKYKEIMSKNGKK